METIGRAWNIRNHFLQQFPFIKKAFRAFRSFSFLRDLILTLCSPHRRCPGRLNAPPGRGECDQRADVCTPSVTAEVIAQKTFLKSSGSKKTRTSLWPSARLSSLGTARAVQVSRWESAVRHTGSCVHVAPSFPTQLETVACPRSREIQTIAGIKGTTTLGEGWVSLPWGGRCGRLSLCFLLGSQGTVPAPGFKKGFVSGKPEMNF